MALRSLLLLLCCACRAASEEDRGIAWSDRIASLEAQVEVQRRRAERAEAALAQALRSTGVGAGDDEAADDEAAPRAIPPAGAASCAAAPYAKIATALPNGSYTKSCSGCVRWEQSVQCHCFSRDAVRPDAALRPGNLTGLWSVGTTPINQPHHPPGSLPPPATPSGMTVRVDSASDGSHFTVRCVKTASVAYSDAGRCAAVGPAASLELWHTGHGIVHVANRSVSVTFDNGHHLQGRLGNGSIFGTIRWEKAHNNSATQLAWSRQNATAVTTSLSLSSCRGAQQLTNDDGHLNCDWKLVPPPRVGRIVQGSSSSNYGRQSVEESCRYVDHVSFVAPQVRKRAYLLRRFILKTIILPRQARDKHRERSTQKREMGFRTVQAPGRSDRLHPEPERDRLAQ